MKTWLLRISAAIGLVLFLIPFGLSYGVPNWVETYAQDFIAAKIEQQLGQGIDAIRPAAGEGRLAQAANLLYEKNEAKVQLLKDQLKAQIPQKMAAVIAEMRDLDCSCRQRYEDFFSKGFHFEIDWLQQANDRLLEAMKGKYMQVANDLSRDVRIFAGSSALIFAILLALSWTRPRAIAHLLLPASLLMLSTLIATWLYVFEQNWLLTIIYGNYQAGIYLLWLGLIFALLMDIVYNKGEVVCGIVNGALDAIGSSASLVPC